MENISNTTIAGENISTETRLTRPTTTFVREVTARYRGPRRRIHRISEPKDAADFIRKVLPDNVREHFIVLYLDGAHKVSAYSVVATGSANACPIHPREVFQIAVLVGAVALVAAHNHPSNDVSPSEADRKITRSLKNAGDILGIKLLDHLVIGEIGFHSCQEHGRGFTPPEPRPLIG